MKLLGMLLLRPCNILCAEQPTTPLRKCLVKERDSQVLSRRFFDLAFCCDDALSGSLPPSKILPPAPITSQ
ncbi:hypothetical protein K443DRAFT_676626 [Laccaria amethystina LaAM-08-1]|uniref:Secreted protein n=1 Tax=Laccaria amethystina LaAM-08-1 TaxID=1095629 RepID=A0A0C9XPV2_9AGAR|nr:hypothetical protein K443DRAFT_676626 [Laccaria amethystina LaAM-08-1]